jgi:hypothetical protein
MVTGANAGTGKGDTRTRSNESMLRTTAPRLRTAEALVEKHEQIQDALEHGIITGKVAEQMNQTLKGILGIEKLGMQYYALLRKFGRNPPVPRSPILRDMFGLPERVSANDEKVLRRMLPEKK